MSENYINNGNVGAMGRGAIAHNVNFGQQAQGDIKLAKSDAESLEIMAEKLFEYKGKEVKKSEIIEGAGIIQTLAENVQEENIEAQQSTLKKWVNYISTASTTLMGIIKVASEGANLVDSVKGILGL